MNTKRSSLILMLAVATILVGSVCYAADFTRTLGSRKASQIAPADLLRSAVFEGNLQDIHRLLAQGADANARDDDGYTLLIWAQLGNRPEAVKLLLDRGAEINAPDGGGYTALHQAAMAGRDAIMEVLLERGASVDSRSRNGWTPLMDAAAYGQVVAVECLLAKGADPNAMTKDGQTAFSLADRKGYQHVKVLLVANGADPELQVKMLKGALARISSGYRGPERVRLAGYLRNPDVLESFCTDCQAVGSDVPLKAVSVQAAALNDRLATLCEQQSRAEVRKALVAGRNPGNSAGVGKAATGPRTETSVTNAELTLREAVETWDRIQAQYPNADKRIRELQQKGALADRISKMEPLLNKAMGAWQSLQREHPDLAAHLLNLAGISR
ncbi:MAG: ankyrin repeat domain-containing protein [Desulfomonile tiedjei]|nr:ankyrin repeat domain-containing protein [Desulfomonile tiedjei]